MDRQESDARAVEIKEAMEKKMEQLMEMQKFTLEAQKKADDRAAEINAHMSALFSQFQQAQACSNRMLQETADTVKILKEDSTRRRGPRSPG